MSPTDNRLRSGKGAERGEYNYMSEQEQNALIGELYREQKKLGGEVALITEKLDGYKGKATALDEALRGATASEHNIAPRGGLRRPTLEQVKNLATEADTSSILALVEDLYSKRSRLKEIETTLSKV